MLADSQHIQWMAHLGLAVSLPCPILQMPAPTYLPHFKVILSWAMTPLLAKQVGSV